MARHVEQARPQKRNGYWYLVRVVPQELAELDTRGKVVVSTHIRIADDPYAVSARPAVAKLDRVLQEFWADLRAGRDPSAQKTFEKAVKRARDLGLTYIEKSELMQLSLDALVERLALLKPLTEQQHKDTAEVVCGMVPFPGTKISELVDEAEKLKQAELNGMSPNQRKKWRKARENAVNLFIDVIGGDKALKEISRDDVLEYRQFWTDRIVSGEVVTDTANSNLFRLSGIFSTVNKLNRLKLDAVFEDIKIAGPEYEARFPYSTDFIQDKFLAEGMFDGLNDEARRIIYVIVETGLRLSEAANLDEKTIFLDGDIPHVSVEPNGRKLKTAESKRKVPLVGVALQAMKAQPKGFPRYRDREASLSALINKALDARDMRPRGAKQSVYSLRHSFSDRLRAVLCPDKTIDQLMGHARKGMRYGEGVDLPVAQKVLNQIVLRGPSRI
ncbi:tyrosine-type recombinase/integrase [Hyphomicrobium sp.]|uniref:tyrosine-type recombinase/integrase n=1 Tax=Hyphomicrobium sp. TaxID=82 RepID=UPI001DCAA28C|nr:tyrosine-type recombinase/integrase [Hyphomicrobium sp.]MBY0560997.1 tyrosine-type recombinase/integrase [Hyphomicrobium sp.]